MIGQRAAPSLRGRALQWLAQREHSRQELGERLRRWVRAMAPESTQAQPMPSVPSEEDVEPVLDALQAAGLLSDARFAESRVHVRAARFGQRRIELELRQHGVEVPQDWLQTLQATEFQRACEVWTRRFGGSPPASPADRARQTRFLAGRGFSGQIIGEVLRWALRGCPEPQAEDPSTPPNPHR